jgi:DNA (cytosine-5)-methyltransferase 1
VIWQAEQNEYCLKVLEKHWPNVTRYTDVNQVDKEVEKPDLICGGFPCQDVSSAGKRTGLSGTRSGLWYEFLRIIKEVRPEWVVIENVASGAKLWVDSVVRGDLEQQGYATFPIPLSAKDCGAWHLRKRIFIVAHSAGNGSHRLPIGAPKRQSLSRSYVKHGQINQSGRTHYWENEPAVDRVVHGISREMDKFRALGNSVVPQCAQVVGEFINQLTTESVCSGE